MSSEAPAAEATPAPEALLVLDGELPSPGLLERLAARHAPVVAADGAGLRLLELGITPEVVIGDLDTVGERRHILEAARSLVIERPDQETNDFEKGLLWLLERGVERVAIVGHGGGMVDHALNNISVAARFARRVRLRLIDDRSIGYLVDGELSIATSAGERISLIPLPRALLRTRGLAWELEREVLELGRREGASNRALGNQVSVAVIEGMIALFRYPASLD